MIPLLLIVLVLIACFACYRAGDSNGYDRGYDNGSKHRNDPVIPPGGTLPFNITKARP